MLKQHPFIFSLFDSILQFVLTAFSFQAVPAASADTLEAQEWPEKYALEIEKEDLYWVVAILDGDTILLSAPDRSLFQVRLLAVDTSEVNGPDSTAECYGSEAALFTMEFLNNRAVHLSQDPANEDVDPYGRKLRYVDVLQEDGTFLRLNDALLSEGMATFPEQYPVTDRTHFEDLEKTAQESGKGLWEACSN